MLQRASSVHVALLTSLSMASLSLLKSSSHHQKGGRRELVQALVSYILSSKSPSSNSGGDECKKTNKNMAVSDRWISCVCGAYVKMDRYGNDNKCSSGSFCRSWRRKRKMTIQWKEITIHRLEYRHKYADGKDRDEGWAAYTADDTRHDIDIIYPTLESWAFWNWILHLWMEDILFSSTFRSFKNWPSNASI